MPFDLFNPDILLKYQHVLQVWNVVLSQENLLELHNRLKDTSVKSIFDVLWLLSNK